MRPRVLGLAALLVHLPSAQALSPSSPAPAPMRFDAQPWSAAAGPTAGPAQVIGGTSEGCLQGGRPLPPFGVGYQLVRPFRRRDVGHPNLIAFVRRLGAAAHEAKLGPLMIGDLAQPRGGPAPTGHASHQTGLDVDVWYLRPSQAETRRLTLEERNAAEPEAVVDLPSRALNAKWDPRIAEVLRLAAEDGDVDRIFVHPRIKKTLCEAFAGAAWLVKVRPWWGHHDHFHARLRCPGDSRACIPQAAIEEKPAQGCGAKLDWWFSPDALATLEKRKAEDQATRAERTLPAACRAVLEGPSATVKASPRPTRGAR